MRRSFPFVVRQKTRLDYIHYLQCLGVLKLLTIGLNRSGNYFYYGSIGNIVRSGKVGWAKHAGKRK